MDSNFEKASHSQFVEIDNFEDIHVSAGSQNIGEYYVILFFVIIIIIADSIMSFSLISLL